MKVLIAMDSFKGTFDSLEVAKIVEKGIRRVYPDAGVVSIPVADGGEGTVDAIVRSNDGRYVYCDVTGPLGDRVKAKYAIVGGNTAVMEMAEASGLNHVPAELRNPLLTTTYGTGELILDAISKGCIKIILGLGGSATNEGGAGMASALGVKFLDESGYDIGMGGGELGRIKNIDVSRIDPRVANVEIIAAFDVDNPLCGEKGASRVFGLQKGADEKMIELLDKNLLHYSEVIEKTLSKSIGEIPGAGAAGGLGAGLVTFCGAKLRKGIEIILEMAGAEEKIKAADVVITGEGRLDGQTIYGKLPVGIAAIAGKYGKPVFAICGSIGEGAEKVYQHGIDGIVSSVVSPMTLEQVIGASPRLIEEAGESLFRVIHAMRREW